MVAWGHDAQHCYMLPQVRIRHDDIPEQIAAEVVSKRNLPEEAIAVIAQVITEQIQLSRGGTHEGNEASPQNENSNKDHAADSEERPSKCQRKESSTVEA